MTGSSAGIPSLLSSHIPSLLSSHSDSVGLFIHTSTATQTVTQPDIAPRVHTPATPMVPQLTADDWKPQSDMGAAPPSIPRLTSGSAAALLGLSSQATRQEVVSPDHPSTTPVTVTTTSGGSTLSVHCRFGQQEVAAFTPALLQNMRRALLLSAQQQNTPVGPALCAATDSDPTSLKAQLWADSLRLQLKRALLQLLRAIGMRVDARLLDFGAWPDYAQGAQHEAAVDPFDNFSALLAAQQHLQQISSARDGTTRQHQHQYQSRFLHDAQPGDAMRESGYESLGGVAQPPRARTVQSAGPAVSRGWDRTAVDAQSVSTVSQLGRPTDVLRIHSSARDGLLTGKPVVGSVGAATGGGEAQQGTGPHTTSGTQLSVSHGGVDATASVVLSNEMRKLLQVLLHQLTAGSPVGGAAKRAASTVSPTPQQSAHGKASTATSGQSQEAQLLRGLHDMIDGAFDPAAQPSTPAATPTGAASDSDDQSGEQSARHGPVGTPLQPGAGALLASSGDDTGAELAVGHTNSGTGIHLSLSQAVLVVLQLSCEALWVWPSAWRWAGTGLREADAPERRIGGGPGVVSVPFAAGKGQIIQGSVVDAGTGELWERLNR